jgi:hypothetical protein
LDTIADMNKIIKNVEFLSDITKDIDEWFLWNKMIII